MKRVLPTILITLIVVLAFSGCADSNSAPVGSSSATEFSSDKPVNTVDEAYWGNQNNGGFIAETDNYIYVGTNNYRIDRKTGEAEYLCIDPTCMHKKKCISAGYSADMMSSGERVFAHFDTIPTSGKSQFVEFQSEGVYKPLMKECYSDMSDGNPYTSSCKAIIDDKAYISIFERIDNDNLNVRFDIIDINSDKVEKSIDLGSMNISEAPEIVYIDGNYIYCVNDYNDYIKVDIKSGKLTKTADNIMSPQPNGNFVYFMRSHKDDDGHDLYKMDTDGKNQTKLLEDVGTNFNVYDSTIYYITASYPKALCSADLSGKNIKKLYEGSDGINGICILPKSKLLVFNDAENGGNGDIVRYRCNLDGSDVKKLTTPEIKE